MRIKTVFFAASLAVFGATPALAQNRHDLFQQALVQEQAEGNLRSAIVLYTRVVSEFPPPVTSAPPSRMSSFTIRESHGRTASGWMTDGSE